MPALYLALTLLNLRNAAASAAEFDASIIQAERSLTPFSPQTTEALTFDKRTSLCQFFRCDAREFPQGIDDMQEQELMSREVVANYMYSNIFIIAYSTTINFLLLFSPTVEKRSCTMQIWSNLRPHNATKLV